MDPPSPCPYISSSPSTPAPTTNPALLPLQSQNPTRRRVNTTDLIGQPFPSFDHQTAVVVPFTDEMQRDEGFEKELIDMLMGALMHAHAWSSVRPGAESAAAAEKLNSDMAGNLKREQDQEHTRGILHAFVMQVKSALGTLIA